MRNIKLVLEYEGTRYHGWQRQRQKPTVQETLEDAVERITGERSVLYGASRTDAGVHARGQAANFHTGSALSPEVIGRALNAVLPRDIAVLTTEEMPEDFNARFSAKSKQYVYVIRNHSVRSAMDKAFHWHFRWSLDLERMRNAAGHLVGRHDFRSFCAAGSHSKDFVREVTALELVGDGAYITVQVEGNGFLYKMVRSMVGTLVEVGRGKIAASEVARILEAKERRLTGPTAPAAGLCLVSVRY